MFRKIVLLLILILLCVSLIGFQTIQGQTEGQTEQPKGEIYDVIVIGGEPEGVAAALAAARRGSTTLLIDKRDGLGGLFTYGMLNQIDLGYDKDRKIANQGIFLEWYNRIGATANFDVPLAQEKFMELVMEEKNITLLLGTEVENVLMEGNKVLGLRVSTPSGEQTIFGKRFIDSTTSADVAAMAGVPYFVGQEDLGLAGTKMPVTLVMLLQDVDWQRMSEAADAGVLGGAKVYKNIAWGFAAVPKVYAPIEENTRVRGLNIGIQKNGLVTINALQIFDVDGLDPLSIEEGIERGKGETEHFVEFLRREIPGFENATIAGSPSELYIRETRHVKAEYQLSITDVWENKDHWDSIGFGAYPVDVQATSVDGYGFVVVAPVQYAIPFRSLIPLTIDHLLVASKSAGYTSLAAGSARTVPIGMTAGEAAGVAANLSLEKKVGFRQMSEDKTLINELQARLKQQGALLYPYQLEYPYEGEWYYPALKKLMPYGLIQAGYANDLHINEDMSEREFLKLLDRIVYQSHPELYPDMLKNFKPWDKAMETDWSIKLTRDQAAKYINLFFGYNNEGNNWHGVIKYGFVDKEIQDRAPTNRKLKKSEGYHLAAHFLQRIQEKKEQNAHVSLSRGMVR